MTCIYCGKEHTNTSLCPEALALVPPCPECAAREKEADEDCEEWERVKNMSQEEVTAELRLAGITDAHEAKSLASVNALIKMSAYQVELQRKLDEALEQLRSGGSIGD